MNTKSFRFFANLSLGLSWAILFAGVFYGFAYYLHSNVFLAILAAIVGAIPGLILVGVFEFFIAFIQYSQDVKKQTFLLEQILQRLK